MSEKYVLFLNYFFINNFKKIFFCLLFFFILFISYGLYYGLFVVDQDFQQKDAFRIMYVHVPSAYMSIFIYIFMGFMSILYFFSNLSIADHINIESSKVGVLFTLLAIFTGSIWGKPMWGVWWIWDARLTSELVLLFLYFGYIALRISINNKDVASKSCAILNLFGLINIPIIHYSVEWWYTLHQKATLSKFSKPSMDLEMLIPLLAMIIGFFLYYILILFISLSNKFLKKNHYLE